MFVFFFGATKKIFKSRGHEVSWFVRQVEEVWYKSNGHYKGNVGYGVESL